MERAPPRRVRLYRSSVSTLAFDLPALIEIIEQDATKGLKSPDPQAVAKAMVRLNSIFVRSRDKNGEALACSVLYDRGELEDGRPLHEFGSVGAWRVPGYGLLPLMARCFMIQLRIHVPDAVLIGIVRFDDEVKNVASLKQLEKSGFVPADPDLLEAVRKIRPVDPGRKVLVFDPAAARSQAELLRTAVVEGVIRNRIETEPDLEPKFDLSPISDGLLDDYLAQFGTDRQTKTG